jgi:hypothetical protein
VGYKNRLDEERFFVGRKMRIFMLKADLLAPLVVMTTVGHES